VSTVSSRVYRVHVSWCIYSLHVWMPTRNVDRQSDRLRHQRCFSGGASSTPTPSFGRRQSATRTFDAMPTCRVVQSFSHPSPLVAVFGAVTRQTDLSYIPPSACDHWRSAATLRCQLCAAHRAQQWRPWLMTPSLLFDFLHLPELVTGKFNAVYYWWKFDANCRSISMLLKQCLTPPDDC